MVIAEGLVRLARRRSACPRSLSLPHSPLGNSPGEVSALMPGSSNITETTVNHWQRRLDDRRRELRPPDGLPMSELARRASLPLSTTRRILLESTTHPPTREQVRAIAKGLRLEFETVWMECLQAWYPDTLLFAEMDEDDVEVLGVARQLSKQDRRRWVRTARAWLHDNDSE